MLKTFRFVVHDGKGTTLYTFDRIMESGGTNHINFLRFVKRQLVKKRNLVGQLIYLDNIEQTSDGSERERVRSTIQWRVPPIWRG